MRIIKYLSYLSLPILYFIAPNAFAGVFDPPPSDQSLAYLGMIFGSNVGTIYLGGAANPVLAQMFEQFNTIIVAIGTVIISYIGIVSTINTAQEGEAMGKKWSSIWLPMRSLMGMLLMVPTPGSGYSMIQVTVMWIIVQGIGAADQIWNIVLNYLSQGISASAGLTLDETEASQLTNQGKNLSASILNTSVCMESIKQIANGLATDASGNPIQASTFTSEYGTVIRTYQVDPPISGASSDPSCPTAATTTAADGTVTMTGCLNAGAKSPTETGDVGIAYATMCGSYQISATVSPTDLSALGLSGSALTAEIETRAQNAYNQKMLALNTMLSTLKPIAQGIVNDTVGPRAGNRLQSGTQPTPSGYITTAANAYETIVGNIIKPVQNDAVTDAVNKGEHAGWIVAGSFYFILNSAIQQELLPTATAAPTVTQYNSADKTVPACPQSSCSGLLNYDSVASLAGIKDYLTNRPERTYLGGNLLDSYEYYTNDSTNPVNNGSIDLSAAGGQASQLIGPLQQLTSQAIQWLQNEMSHNSMGDPLLGIASFGSRLMLAAEITWIVIIGVSIIASIAATCAAASPGFMILLSTLITAVPVVIAVMGMLWLEGATLAIYVPMVPYMIYTLAALGWFILVIEAMIAAPIVSMGLVIPSGDELGKVVPGLMLLINILLRPVLMIFGFILAARLFRAVVSLVNFGMADTFNTIPIRGSFLAPIAAIFLYVGFIVALVNKCFALIHIVPDKILRWIGGPTEQTDTSAMQEAKQHFEKGAQQTGKVAGEGIAGGSAKWAKGNMDSAGDGGGQQPPKQPQQPPKGGNASSASSSGSSSGSGLEVAG